MRPAARIAVFFFFFFFFTVVVGVVQSSSILGVGNRDEDIDEEEVKVSVNSAISIAKTDENFICSTLDWWPQDKCDYGQCPWGNAGLLNLVISLVLLLLLQLIHFVYIYINFFFCFGL